ncbi:hypothetical protein [Vibrio lentus]|uniref:hypothetical protein n=1 Tax=Vibrio lentus TaxID=136468 RepID=UPI000977F603|nr:hypothetical protein [Vibrio lentus]OMO21238.1 hypothetical protein BH583_10860 [Vibrio lentus]PMN15150.1 hypothetical protein BCT38_00380 [Vibrio lentus]
MDISISVTEPFFNYHNFHENLNTRVKIMTGALCHTLTFLSEPENENKMGELIKAADSSWQFPPVFSLENHTNTEIYNYVSELAIFSSFSAMDDCFTSIDAELTRWKSFKKIEVKKVSVDSDDKIEKFYGRYSWCTHEIAKFLPIFNYFQAIRNCIAHRNSKASNELVELSNSRDLTKAIQNLFPRGEPLPTFDLNQNIYLNPKTTLLCSHINRLICKDMNRHLLNEFGKDGLVYMACYHAFFKDSPEETQAVNQPETVLNSMLCHRYKVILEGQRAPADIAKNLGIWSKCLRGFETRKIKLSKK